MPVPAGEMFTLTTGVLPEQSVVGLPTLNVASKKANTVNETGVPNAGWQEAFGMVMLVNEMVRGPALLYSDAVEGKLNEPPIPTVVRALPFSLQFSVQLCAAGTPGTFTVNNGELPAQTFAIGDKVTVPAVAPAVAVALLLIVLVQPVELLRTVRISYVTGEANGVVAAMNEKFEVLPIPLTVCVAPPGASR